MNILAYVVYLLFFFGLGLLGAITLYCTVRYAERMRHVVLFGCVGVALLAAQCALVKFAADFGAAFGGEYASALVLGCVGFSVVALTIFVVAVISKFSNGR